MVNTLVAIVVGFYIVQVIGVILVIVGDIIYQRDECFNGKYIHYKSKKQLIIDLIPGSWILKVIKFIKEWYKTLK